MDWKLHEHIKLEGDGNGSGGGASGDGSGDASSGGQAGGADGQDGGSGGQAGGADGAAGQSGSGSGGKDWRTGITDEYLRGNPALKDYADITSLAKSHVDLQSHLGNAVRVPGPDASAEDKQAFYSSLVEKAPNLMVKPNLDNETDRDAFYRTLGRPDKPEDYKVPEIDTGDTKVSMKSAELFREVAFKRGLSQEQYAAVVKDVTLANVKAAHDADIEVGNQLVSLKEDWGLKFEDNVSLAVKAAERTNAPTDLINTLKANKASKATLVWLHGIAVKLGGGEGLNMVGDEGGSNLPPGTLTPAEAQARISEMLNNRQHPVWDPHHPEHADAVKRRLELQKMASPSASTDDSIFIRR